MKRFSYLALAACLSFAFLSLAKAALIEHNLVVEPDFVHGNERNSTSSTTSQLDVTLPSLTLAPGDIVRVTVEFTGGRYLKLPATPLDGALQFGAGLALSQDTINYFPGDGDGATDSVQFLDAQSRVIFSNTQPSDYAVNFAQQQLTYVDAQLAENFEFGEPADFTIGKLVFEIEMPTTITTRNGSFPYQTTTFTNNYIGIGSYLYRFGYFDMPDAAIYVVPEPHSLLLAVAVLLAIPSRRVYHGS